MIIGNCEICNSPIKIYPSSLGRKKYCSWNCRTLGKKKDTSGTGNNNYKGGLKIQNNYAKTPHFFMWDRDKKQSVHRLKAERVLNRKLNKNEIVHHINGNSLDNKNSNLMICDVGYHQWLHMKMAHLYMNEHFQ